MIPRAEIAMVIMQKGHDLGSWAVPNHVLSAMVLVVLVTSVAAPVVLRRLLNRLPREGSPS
jgi:hypothetical protein